MKKRILAAILAVLMLLPFALGVFAAEESTDVKIPDYTKQSYASKAAKLATMEQCGTSPDGNMIMYYDRYSGEFGIKNLKTGDIVLSNPYDISSSSLLMREMPYALSQLDLTFTSKSGGTSKTLHSYSDCFAVNRALYKIFPLASGNGIRVDYVLGEQEKRLLIPNKIRVEDFEALLEMMKGGEAILAEAEYQLRKNLKEGAPEPTEEQIAAKADELYENIKFQILGGYMKYGKPSDKYGISETQSKIGIKEYPIAATHTIYVIKSAGSGSGTNRSIESYLKKYCGLKEEELKKYIDDTYKTVEEKGIDDFSTEDRPRFDITATYMVTNEGLVATVDMASLKYDETKYTVNSITLLPYFNAAHASHSLPAGKSGSITDCDKGYTFIPDGSGALVRFEDLFAENNKQVKFENEMYGNDYAYYQVKTKNSENMTMPVFGLTNETEKTGFFAVIEDGDALSIVTSNHSTAYHSIYTTFKITPSDEYDLADAFSGGATSSKVIGINASKIYKGECKVSYKLLVDDEVAAEAGLESDEYYQNSYVGMAKCYREYLQEMGALTKLTSKDINKDFTKVFLETFGSIEVEEKIATFPVTVSRELTTFTDIKDIYKELASAGVKNPSFILKGYTNGGLLSTYPCDMDWEDSVGGTDGLVDLLSYASKNNFDVIPDVDFSYSYANSFFSDYSNEDHGLRTLDNRYSTKRTYYAATQTFERTGGVAVSSASFADMYALFYESISEFNISFLAVRSLGSDLNSDFNEDDYYDREASKDNVVAMLKLLKGESGNKSFKLVLDAGNAYATPYADAILSVSLDSSRRSEMSESIPFFGMVYHGSVEFAGNAFNMEGDTDFAFLKAIENGAVLYFTIAKQNVELLKFDPVYNKYYSVSYDNLKDTIKTTYAKYNEAMKDVQDKYIVDHAFIDGAVRTEDGSTVDSSQVVMVQYEGGIGFVLNYTCYEISVTLPNGENAVIAPFGFAKYYK